MPTPNQKSSCCNAKIVTKINMSVIQETNYFGMKLREPVCEKCHNICTIAPSVEEEKKYQALEDIKKDTYGWVKVIEEKKCEVKNCENEFHNEYCGTSPSKKTEDWEKEWTEKSKCYDIASSVRPLILEHFGSLLSLQSEEHIRLLEEMEAPEETEYDLEAFHEGFFAGIEVAIEKIKSNNKK